MRKARLDVILFAALMAGIWFCLISPAVAQERYGVQAGSFSSLASAEKLVKSLDQKGQSCRAVRVQSVYKVLCGSYPSHQAATDAAQNVKKAGAKGAFVAVLPKGAVSYEHVAAPVAGGALSVQVGSYSDSSSANAMVSKMAAQGVNCSVKQAGGLNKVVCGNFTNRAEADSYLASIRSKGNPDAFLASAVSVAAAPSFAAAPEGKSFSVQVGSFSNAAAADETVSAMGAKGTECYINKVGTLNKVICGRFGARAEVEAYKAQLKAMGYGDAFTVALSSDVYAQGGQSFAVGVGAAPTTTIAAPAPEMPAEPAAQATPQEAAAAPEEVGAAPQPVMPAAPTEYIRRVPPRTGTLVYAEPGAAVPVKDKCEDKLFACGYVHPFASMSIRGTDNLFANSVGQESDTILALSAGLWMSTPNMDSDVFQINTENAALGGYMVMRMRPALETPFAGYLRYMATAEFYTSHSDNNEISHNAQTNLHLGTSQGHSLDLMDVYNISYESPNETILNRDLNKYWNNRLSASVQLALSDNTKFRFDYVNFMLSYNSVANQYKDRKDSQYSAYLIFDLDTKERSIFIEGDMTNVNYDQAVIPDANEVDMLMGMAWVVPNQTSGTVKAGYSRRTVDGTTPQFKNGMFVGFADIVYPVTAKTTFNMTLRRWRTETHSPASMYSVTHSANLAMRQKFSDKFSGNVGLGYSKDDEQGTNIKSNTTTANLGLSYSPRRWMSANAGYSYITRSSSTGANDYGINTASAGLSFSF